VANNINKVLLTVPFGSKVLLLVRFVSAKQFPMLLYRDRSVQPVYTSDNAFSVAFLRFTTEKNITFE
jgi:hypothetical protein